jgi:phosphoribosylformylglycinamidine (FGAM) synthase-like enzyme
MSPAQREATDHHLKHKDSKVSDLEYEILQAIGVRYTRQTKRVATTSVHNDIPASQTVNTAWKESQ